MPRPNSHINDHERSNTVELLMSQLWLVLSVLSNIACVAQANRQVRASKHISRPQAVQRLICPAMCSRMTEQQQQPPAKRARFSAKMVKMASPRTDRPRDHNAPVQLTIHDWGQNAMQFFPGRPRSMPLWQVQVSHEVHNGVGYMMNSTVKDVLPKFREGSAVTLEAMEKVHSIKYTNTGGKNDNFDKDDIGLQPWRVAFYVAGANCHAVLELLKLVVQRKLENGQLILEPELQVVGTSAVNLHGHLPEGWVYKQVTEIANPFICLPPKGRRHLWLQVELSDGSTSQKSSTAAVQQESGEPREEEAAADSLPRSDEAAGATTSWILMFFGGIYDFRDRFEAQGIEGGHVEQGSESKDYVRKLVADLTAEGKETVLKILGDGVLRHAPVALLNATEAQDDPMVNWLLDQRAIHLHQDPLP